jgi:hypothetical protein
VFGPRERRLFLLREKAGRRSCQSNSDTELGNWTPSIPTGPFLNSGGPVTTEQFYTKLRFKALRNSYHGDERTIIMERDLAPA